tara:strand:+ start:215 stop:406 length:192 start_codon:yes stop_codon:yes gene_type:complete
MTLSEYLNYSGKTQIKFAEEVGASAGAVKKWVYGERFPRRAHLSKIKNATQGNVTPNDFISKI